MTLTRSPEPVAISMLSRRLPEEWLAAADDSAPISSNQPALEMPFQRWFKFKEAFSPQFILECVRGLDRFPSSCLDPFGGSGTTALTCQLLGVKPTTIEVNPFLADLIRAKLHTYNLEELKRDYLKVLEVSARLSVNAGEFLRGGPDTLVEPGRDSRWIYSRAAAERIVAIREAISLISSDSHRALLMVVLGSVLVPLSNVIVNGKGRKYRRGWEVRQKLGSDVERAFKDAFVVVYTDLAMFNSATRSDFAVLRGDSRELIGDCEPVDLAIFSPPYPNSFDYTDIYNLELWMLGYLSSKTDNTELRNETVRSHVQVKRDFSVKELRSAELQRAYGRLCRKRDVLWDDSIPEMVLAYFGDMQIILRELRKKLSRRGKAFLAVGNSKYAGVVIDTAQVLKELAPSVGFRCCKTSAIRSMRSSAQQGGRFELSESLIVLA